MPAADQPVSIVDRINAGAGSAELALPAPVEGPRMSPDDLHELAGEQELDELVSSDPLLTLAVLRDANSPIYSGLPEVATVHPAIKRLGAKRVAALAKAGNDQRRHGLRHDDLAAMVDPVWRHSRAVALGARWLAGRLRYPELGDVVFVGGLVHDVGKLLLLRVLDEIRTQMLENETDLPPSLADELIEATHAEHGGGLLARWNMPEVYRQIARDHNRDDVDLNDAPLAIVRLANGACRKLGIGPRHDPRIVLVAMDDAAWLGADDVLLAELEIFLEDSVLAEPPHPPRSG